MQFFPELFNYRHPLLFFFFLFFEISQKNTAKHNFEIPPSVQNVNIDQINKVLFSTHHYKSQ